MIKLLADENLDNTIIRGLLRRNPDIDIVRVQDINLSGEDDPIVLEWAAHQGRILLTHDVATITRYAYERLAKNLAMPGVIEIHADAAIGRVIEDLLTRNFIKCLTNIFFVSVIYLFTKGVLMSDEIITQVIEEMNDLPDDLQQQVLQFIETLR